MWMRVDDGLHAHRKTRAVTKGHPEKMRDAAPMGLWTLAGSWSGRNNRDGWVPVDELDRFDDDWEALAKRLVSAGFWWPEQRDGEDGYGFNDWDEWNNPTGPSASGTFGNHKRWHENKGIVKEGCEHCPQEPDHGSPEPDDRPDSPPTRPDHRGDVAPESHPSRPPMSEIDRPDSLTQPDPSPSRPIPKGGGDAPEPPGRSLALVNDARLDVERVCDHLADQIQARGAKRPSVTGRWRNEARLMLDNDKRTEEEVHGAIRWLFTSTHRDAEFWRTNVRSMPKLRTEYDRLRELSQRSSSPPGRNGNHDLTAAMQRAQAKEAQMRGEGA